MAANATYQNLNAGTEGGTGDMRNIDNLVKQLKNPDFETMSIAGVAGVTAPSIVTLTATTVKATAASNLAVNSGTTATDLAGKTVRINSITNTGTANSLIGFQSKPAQGASMANNVIGAEISPRMNDTFALTGTGSLIGLHVDTFLKGTSAGTIAGDVRGMQIEMVTDDAGTRTVSGDVVGLRFRSAWSGTITGKMIAIQINKPEAQTNSKTYHYVLDLPSTIAGVWNNAPGTEPSTADGYFKVRVNGADRYVQLYSTAPTD